MFSEEFISLHNTLYQLLSDGAFSDFCFLKSPDGIVLELFNFILKKKEKEQFGTSRAIPISVFVFPIYLKHMKL